MHPKSPKWLDDMQGAIDLVLRFTEQAALADYEADDLLRSAVERQLHIVGEAMVRLERTDAATAAQISDYRKIIGFRHRLAHGYGDEIDDAHVWLIVEEFLPALRADIARLLAEAEAAFNADVDAAEG